MLFLDVLVEEDKLLALGANSGGALPPIPSASPSAAATAAAAIPSSASAGSATRPKDSVLLSLARDIAAMSANRKGKYTSLASLCRKLGAAGVLEICPGLLPPVLQAMCDTAICAPAVTFLNAFLEKLKEEKPEVKEFCSILLPSLLPTLCGPSSSSASSAAAAPLTPEEETDAEAARTNIGLYALPVVLRHQPKALLELIK
jgi:hypothetical protein